MPSKKPKAKDPLARIGDYAVPGGPADWADNHDFYIYGAIADRKRTNSKLVKAARKKRAGVAKRSKKNG